jgi:hypothetical protein
MGLTPGLVSRTARGVAHALGCCRAARRQAGGWGEAGRSGWGGWGRGRPGLRGGAGAGGLQHGAGAGTAIRGRRGRLCCCWAPLWWRAWAARWMQGRAVGCGALPQAAAERLAGALTGVAPGPVSGERLACVPWVSRLQGMMSMLQARVEGGAAAGGWVAGARGAATPCPADLAAAAAATAALPPCLQMPEACKGVSCGMRGRRWGRHVGAGHVGRRGLRASPPLQLGAAHFSEGDRMGVLTGRFSLLAPLAGAAPPLVACAAWASLS